MCRIYLCHRDPAEEEVLALLALRVECVDAAVPAEEPDHPVVLPIQMLLVLLPRVELFEAERALSILAWRTADRSLNLAGFFSLPVCPGSTSVRAQNVQRRMGNLGLCLNLGLQLQPLHTD